MMISGISSYTPIRQAQSFGKKSDDVWALRDKLKEVEKEITSAKAEQFIARANHDDDKVRAIEYRIQSLENKKAGINWAINRALAHLN